MQNIDRLVQFLDSTPTAWHAVHNVQKRLDKVGFLPLDEAGKWKLKQGNGYYVVRSGSIIAFRLPKKKIDHALCFAAHTDSPGLKLKPHGAFMQNGVELLHFDIYGAPILATWVGRELYLAGRLFYEDGTSELVSHRKHPIFIPNLALHLDRQVNETGLMVHKQDHLKAMSSTGKGLEKVLGKKKIVYKELMAVPVEPPVRCGVSGEWLTASRLDNLASCASALEAFCAHKESAGTLSMIAFFNHEEIGSETQEGAASPFFSDSFSRILALQGATKEDELICKARSLTISCDVAHAAHPNHLEKHDEHHQVELGKGICIKTNAFERYHCPADIVSKLIKKCNKKKLSYQFFSARNDIPSGMTIGPIHAAQTGFKTIDLGIPVLGMHAAREMMAVSDYANAIETLCCIDLA